jgi:hypothetical protein
MMVIVDQGLSLHELIESAWKDKLDAFGLSSVDFIFGSDNWQAKWRI